MKINNFSIIGLYGHFSICVPIKNNRLVLVGENGSGKSSFVLLLYYLLSKQWERLETIQFNQLTIQLDDKEFSFKKEEIIGYNHDKKRRTNAFPTELVTPVINAISELNLSLSPTAIDNVEYHEKLQEYINIRFSMPIYNRIIQSIISYNSTKKYSSIREFENYINENVDYNLIFLPTYRRIEKDFETIFANQENVITGRSVRIMNRTRTEKSELVAFGMQDVIKIIDMNMRNLNNSFRSSLQSIISEYLLDVLGNRYNNINISALNYDELENIDIILDKIGGEILPEDEKNLVKEKIENIKTKREGEIEDKIIMDFILKIVSLQKTQIELEQDVELFVNIVNKYFVNKEFVFDRSVYQLRVNNTLTNEVVDLNNLSSGEKQVVSLFAHLFLREKSKYLLIFDEPELSLSVPWQKTFLEDISQSKNCLGVIAVTHSPFIYDNSMEKYCTAINEYFKVN
jgi:energy-coupling factor transporter ATP-binding protein EcfA2